MLANRRPITIDIGFIIAALMFIFVFSLVNLPIKDKDIPLIPSAIEGITTVTGLLFALDGLLITRYYSDSTSSIQKIRGSLYVLVLAIGSFFIGMAYISLLLDAPMLALKIALVVFNISYSVAVAFVFHFVYFLDFSNYFISRRPKS